MYSIVSRNYMSGQMLVVEKSNNFREIVSRAEEYAQLFVESKMGEKNTAFYRRLKKYSHCPFGYFVCKHDRFCKFTVMLKREIRGYISNSVKVDKVIDFQVCRDPSVRIIADPIPLTIFGDIDIKCDSWRAIHEELLEKRPVTDEKKTTESV